MKRIIALVACAVMILSMSACSGDKKGSPSTGTDLTWEEIMKEVDRQLAEEAKNAG